MLCPRIVPQRAELPAAAFQRRPSSSAQAAAGRASRPHPSREQSARTQRTSRRWSTDPHSRCGRAGWSRWRSRNNRRTQASMFATPNSAFAPNGSRTAAECHLVGEPARFHRSAYAPRLVDVGRARGGLRMKTAIACPDDFPTLRRSPKQHRSSPRLPRAFPWSTMPDRITWSTDTRTLERIVNGLEASGCGDTGRG